MKTTHKCLFSLLFFALFISGCVSSKEDDELTKAQKILAEEKLKTENTIIENALNDTKISNIPQCEKEDILCWKELALKTSNVSMCVKIHNDYMRDNCYSDVANKINNPSICMSVIYPEIRDKCYKRINLEGLDANEVCSTGWTVESRSGCREAIEEANR